MFSADLSPEDRHSRLGHMASVPTAAFLSGADQFVPPLPHIPIDGGAGGAGGEGGGGSGSGGRTPMEVLAETFRAAMVSPSSSSSTADHTTVDDAAAAAAASTAATKTVAFVIDRADHGLSDPTHAQEFIAKVEAFVAGLED